MEAKHTPGPWTAGWTGNVGEPGLGRPCVGTAGAADWVGPEGAEADARLIAAAPDLLAALRKALEWVEHVEAVAWDSIPEGMRGDNGAAWAIRSAIARATGGGA